MRIIRRTDKMIMAIHEDMLIMFNVAALGEVVTSPDRRLIGMLINKYCMTEKVYATSKFHELIMQAPEIVELTKKRFDGLIDSSNKLDALEAGGVDNWTWYGESLKGYWEEKEKVEEKREAKEDPKICFTCVLSTYSSIAQGKITTNSTCLSCKEYSKWEKK